MAMNPGTTPDPEHHGARDGRNEPDPDTAIVDEAASALRSYTDRGWSGASHRILGHVSTATRRSRPVRACGDEGPFLVSDQVVTAYLQAAVDAVAGAEATHVGLDLDDGSLVAVRIGISVDYPERIHPLADEVRTAAHAGLRAVLGVAQPPALGDIEVHVHDVKAPDRPGEATRGTT